MKKILTTLTVVAATLLSSAAQAVLIKTYDLSVDDVAWAEVTVTYSTAAELGTSQNLFEYRVKNLTDAHDISLFRVRNHDGIAGTLEMPAGWLERHVTNYLWETPKGIRDNMIAPGETLAGFKIWTDGVYQERSGGWALFDLNGARTNALGVIGTPSEVPVPAAAWLFASALLGLVTIKRNH